MNPVSAFLTELGNISYYATGGNVNGFRIRACYLGAYHNRERYWVVHVDGIGDARGSAAEVLEYYRHELAERKGVEV